MVNEFIPWLKQTLLKVRQNSVMPERGGTLMIVDSASGHRAAGTLAAFDDITDGVPVAIIPGGITSIVQYLDVNVFGAMKARYATLWQAARECWIALGQKDPVGVELSSAVIITLRQVFYTIDFSRNIVAHFAELGYLGLDRVPVDASGKRRWAPSFACINYAEHEAERPASSAAAIEMNAVRATRLKRTAAHQPKITNWMVKMTAPSDAVDNASATQEPTTSTSEALTTTMPSARAAALVARGVDVSRIAAKLAADEKGRMLRVKLVAQWESLPAALRAKTENRAAGEDVPCCKATKAVKVGQHTLGCEKRAHELWQRLKLSGVDAPVEVDAALTSHVDTPRDMTTLESRAQLHKALIETLHECSSPTTRPHAGRGTRPFVCNVDSPTADLGGAPLYRSPTCFRTGYLVLGSTIDKCLRNTVSKQELQTRKIHILMGAGFAASETLITTMYGDARDAVEASNYVIVPLTYKSHFSVMIVRRDERDVQIYDSSKTHFPDDRKDEVTKVLTQLDKVWRPDADTRYGGQDKVFGVDQRLNDCALHVINNIFEYLEQCHCMGPFPKLFHTAGGVGDRCVLKRMSEDARRERDGSAHSAGPRPPPL